MADLSDGFLRALAAYLETGLSAALALAAAGPWTCCAGAVQRGPGGCTCWTPLFDLDQSTPDPTAPVQPRHAMCSDCAYRPGSPERTGDEDVAGDAAQLEQLAADGTPFWCHDGMREPVRWCHPSGLTIPAHSSHGDYQPPQIDGVPYRADGRPGLLCAGWHARRRALTARAETRRGG